MQTFTGKLFLQNKIKMEMPYRRVRVRLKFYYRAKACKRNFVFEASAPSSDSKTSSLRLGLLQQALDRVRSRKSVCLGGLPCGYQKPADRIIISQESDPGIVSIWDKRNQRSQRNQVEQYAQSSRAILRRSSFPTIAVVSIRAYPVLS